MLNRSNVPPTREAARLIVYRLPALIAQREAARLAAEAQAAKQAASAAQRDRQAGLRTVHMHEVTNHQAAMLWIAENDKPALLEWIEQYAAKHHRAAPIAGVRTWTEQRAY